jgi:hypothetical protein
MNTGMRELPRSRSSRISRKVPMDRGNTQYFSVLRMDTPIAPLTEKLRGLANSRQEPYIQPWLNCLF